MGNREAGDSEPEKWHHGLDSTSCAGFEDSRRDHNLKKLGKIRKQIPSHSLQKGREPCQHLDFSSVRLKTFDLRSCKIVNLGEVTKFVVIC